MPGGRPTKYPIKHLEIGDVALIPWDRDEKGRRKSLKPAVNAICMYRRRTGKDFQWWLETAGLRVKRVR